MIPNSPETELLVIGTVLLDGRLSYELKQLSTVDFYSARNARIWGAICALDEEGQALNVAEIHRRANIETLKLSELTQMTMGIPPLMSLQKEVTVLKNLTALRTLQKGFSEFVDRIEHKADLDSIVADTENLLSQVSVERDAVVGTSIPLVQVFERDVFPRIDRYVSGELVKVPFGWKRLDDSTNGGVSLGELVVLGANPKAGKSAMLLQIGRQQAEQGLGCYICSREMLNYENGQRIITQTHPDFTANHWRPNLFSSTAEKMKEHARNIQIPLHFDDKSKSVADIRKELRRLEDNGTDIVSVLVDYVQLIKGVDGKNRADVLEDIIYDLKDLAMEQEKVVICNAQFNRDGIDSVRPKMSDFKGSSAIEMAANLILLWTLEQGSPQDRYRTGKLWIEAGRSVSYDEFDLVYYGSRTVFELQ